MPIDYKKYVGWWRQFSEYIRFERAGNRCECTGECGYDHQGRCAARNGKTGKTGRDGVWRETDSIHSLNSSEGMYLYPDFDFIGTKVCLTVAHLDYDGGSCQCKTRFGIKCARPEHVLALCQACHLKMDLPHHIEKRKQGVVAQKDAQRGLLNL